MEIQTHATGPWYVDGLTLPKAIGSILRGSKKPARFESRAHARHWFLVDSIRTLVKKVHEHNAKGFSQPRALSRRDYPVLYRQEAPSHLFEQVYHSLCATIGVSLPKAECIEHLRKSVTRIILASHRPDKKQVGRKKALPAQLALFH
ncbi:hypothetical protein IT401_01390 [Candidatus Nomurabacteria bacterium]|nr:hypothetical protein [Candidatus Nomurabacteria bacterium]